MFKTKHEEHLLRKCLCLSKLSANRKENELHRKDKVLGGSTENDKASPIFEIEQNGWFHWI